MQKEQKLIEELEEYRLDNRITQQELADLLGVSFVTINRWLNRHQYPNKIQSYHIRKLIGKKGLEK
ncbi:MAG: helix-turn-helix domain-containing protein [candidate division Zixibacteria bacterium]|nr:helix-turn-helix domain-containing protein [candidate division Zixibacteria bacterium]